MQSAKNSNQSGNLKKGVLDNGVSYFIQSNPKPEDVIGKASIVLFSNLILLQNFVFWLGLEA